MNRIDSDQINSLPFHDSSILFLKIEQDGNGNTESQIGIKFLSDEVIDLEDSEKECINDDGTAFLVLEDCRWIGLNMVCNITKRDKIDFIRFLNKSEKPQELESLDQKFSQIEITLISGSVLKCIFSDAYLSAK